nr:PREDICTED: deuterosome protein 1 isoform X2 [Latimeria chalumnae]|eukprot:XP_014353814.1 PREDICTED: deuterosome protein 1 isoform X2 [Latimeria chalumnae]
MHQIDIMVNHKKSEWEKQMLTLEAKLKVQEAELVNTCFNLEKKHQEVGMLRQHLDTMENSKQELVEKYEDQLTKFKSEFNKLKTSYEKLQRYQLKQAKERSEKYTDGSEVQLEISYLSKKLQEFKDKSKEWDKQRLLYQSQLASLEAHRKALTQKCESFQQHSQNYQSQVGSRKEVQGELSSQSDTWILRNQLESIQELVKSNELTIENLNAIVEEMTTSKNQLQKEKEELQHELRQCQRQYQNLESELSELRIELQSRDDLLRATELEQIQLQKELSKMKEYMDKQGSARRAIEENSQKLMTSEFAHLKVELENTRQQLEASLLDKKMLRSEITRLQAGLESSHSPAIQLNEKLTKKTEELNSLKREQTEQQVENIKLRERLLQIEKSHSSEMEGVRTEVSNLTAELYQKDITIATITEKAAHLEKQLKLELEKRERNLSQYQVARIQIETLTIENKHLKELVETLDARKLMTTNNMEQELQDSYYACITKLEGENRELQSNLSKLQKELEVSSQASQEKYESALRQAQQTIEKMKEHEDRRVQQLQKENEWKINALQSKLDDIIQYYESEIQALQNLNSTSFTSPLFKSRIEPKLREVPDLQSSAVNICDQDNLFSEGFPNIATPGTSLHSFYSQIELLPLSPTKMSFTTSAVEQFFQEEDKRARELEKALNYHVDELRKNSEHTIQRYVPFQKMDMFDYKPA